MKKKILFVAMQMSIHTARWINQISSKDYEIHVYPINNMNLHPLLRGKVIFHQPETIDHSLTKLSFLEAMKRITKFLFRSPLIRQKLRKLSRSMPPQKAPQYHYFWGTEACIPVEYGPLALVRVINKVKPDLIHSLEFQTCGYNVLGAKLLVEETKDHFPKWLATNWGSDIYYYQHDEKHLKIIKDLLSHADYYSCECHRDVDLARSLGFSGSVMPVIPNTGGFDLIHADKLRSVIKPSKRKLIMVKGYQHFAGRALTALEAIERCADKLKGYGIKVYSSYTTDVWNKIDYLREKLDLDITALPYTDHKGILHLFSKSRIYLGVSLSDAISTSLLEAIAMGTFPIQTNTSCCEEWIKDGVTGYVISPDDIEGIVRALSSALVDDDLVDRAFHENWKCIEQRLDARKLEREVSKFYHQIFKQ